MTKQKKTILQRVIAFAGALFMTQQVICEQGVIFEILGEEKVVNEIVVEADDVIDNKWAAFLVSPNNPAYQNETEARAILEMLSNDSVIGNVARASLKNSNDKVGTTFATQINGVGAGIDNSTKEINCGGSHANEKANGKLTEIPDSYLNAMVTAMQKDLGNTTVGKHTGTGMGYRTFYQASWDIDGTKKPSLVDNFWSRTLGMFSEHCTGCAVDFNLSYNNLTTKGSYETLKSNATAGKEFEWLCANAHKYGFIWRFRGNSSDKTGTIWEGWHWRFVGVFHATKFWEKCEHYTTDKEYVWEDYYNENIKGKSGYPTSVYDALVNIYPNDTSKCAYGSSPQSNAGGGNNANGVAQQGDNLQGGMYKGEHGCQQEVSDLKNHNYPMFQQLNTYINSNAENVLDKSTWDSVAMTLLQQGSGVSGSSAASNFSTGSYNPQTYIGNIDALNSYTYIKGGKPIPSDKWIDLLGVVAVEYVKSNHRYTSGGYNYTYNILGKKFNMDACCTTILNLCFAYLDVGINTNSAGYATDTNIKNKMNLLGFKWIAMSEAETWSAEKWSQLPAGTIFVSSGKKKASHTEIFMGWGEGGAYSYDSGKGGRGGTETGSLKTTYGYTEGSTFQKPFLDKSGWSLSYIQGWFDGMYVLEGASGTATGVIPTSAVLNADTTDSNTLKYAYQKDNIVQSLGDIAFNLIGANTLEVSAAISQEYDNDNEETKKKYARPLITLSNGETSKKVRTSNTGKLAGTGGSHAPNDVNNDGLEGNNDAERCWNFFRSRGFSENLTAGIMANIAEESMFDWTIMESASGKGYGHSYDVPPYQAMKGWGLIQFTDGNGVSAKNIANVAAKQVTGGAYDACSLRGQLEVIWAIVAMGDPKADTCMSYTKQQCGNSGVAYGRYNLERQLGRKGKAGFDYLNSCSVADVVKYFHNGVEVSAGGGAAVTRRTALGSDIMGAYSGRAVVGSPTNGSAASDPYIQALEIFRGWIAKQTDTQLKSLAQGIWYCWNDDGKGIDYHNGGSMFEDDPEIIIPPVEFILTALSGADKKRLAEIQEDLRAVRTSTQYRVINIMTKVLSILLLLYTILYTAAYLMDRSDIFVNSMLSLITLGRVQYVREEDAEMLTGDETYFALTDKKAIVTIVISVIACGLMANTSVVIQMIAVIYSYAHH